MGRRLIIRAWRTFIRLELSLEAEPSSPKPTGARPLRGWLCCRSRRRARRWRSGVARQPWRRKRGAIIGGEMDAVGERCANHQPTSRAARSAGSHEPRRKRSRLPSRQMGVQAAKACGEICRQFHQAPRSPRRASRAKAIWIIAPARCRGRRCDTLAIGEIVSSARLRRAAGRHPSSTGSWSRAKPSCGAERAGLLDLDVDSVLSPGERHNDGRPLSYSRHQELDQGEADRGGNSGIEQRPDRIKGS